MAQRPQAQTLLASFARIAVTVVGLVAADSCPGRQLNIALDGKIYNVGFGGQLGQVSPDGQQLSLMNQDHGSIVNRCDKVDGPPKQLTLLHLGGRTLTFTVDLSQVGCACNMAVYLVSAPARSITEIGIPGSDEKFSGKYYIPGKDGMYYCDANGVGGQWCPEIDLMEANNRATPHVCTPIHYVDYYHNETCDRIGCGTSTRKVPGAYGPGPGFVINTLLPFKVSTFFESSDMRRLTGIKTFVYQEEFGRRLEIRHFECRPDYLAKLTKPIADGMSLVLSYWGDRPQTMAWMDMPPCGPTACVGPNAGVAVIKDIEVTTGLPPDIRLPMQKDSLVIPPFGEENPLPASSPVHTMLAWVGGPALCLSALAAASVSIGALSVLRARRMATMHRASGVALSGGMGE